MQPPHGDDELLASYASALADAIDAALGPWIVRSVLGTCDRAGIPVDAGVTGAADLAAQRCRDDVAPRIRTLLATDPDEQRTTPLSLLRGAVRYPTEVLDALGAPHAVRDQFEVRAFPDDLFGLAPASFGDVDESLIEPGIVWGAAKAHVHRTRHRSDG